jgi:phosphotransferase system  glucose/maltose/N-acetylglucosamine-specific IIC component
VGLAPHVLHHIGLLAGTALVAGAAGTTVFGLLGLVAAIPLLLRLKRRFGSWWAPAIGLAVFAAMFLLSAFVIGPAISDRDRTPANPPTPSPSSHSEHHP